MRPRSLAALLLGSLVVTPASASGDKGVSLRDTLLARAGRTPVYLSHGKNGLAAAAADGSWSRTLVKGAVAAAALDAAQDLVWLVRGDRLEVLDLREPAPQPVPIVARWYTKTDTFVSTPVVAVSGVSSASTDNSYAGVYPTLKFSGKPRIGTSEGAYGGIWEDQDAVAKKAIRKAKIVGGAWLKAQLGRKARASAPQKSSKEAAAPRVAVPEELAHCEDDETCGEAKRFGPTGWLLVVVEYGCGDACHTGCLLQDPATKKFTGPTAPAAWDKKPEVGACEGYLFDSAGKTYLFGDKVCTVNGCRSAHGTAFAWLDGGGVKL